MRPVESSGKEIKVRPPAVAGAFYPADPAVLRKQVEKLLDGAEPRDAEGAIRALISPHAGYVYSGGTAAFGYKLLKGKRFKRVIVLAPSHRSWYEGGSIPDVTHYETPLGKIPLDREACDALLEAPDFRCVPGAHRQEHSLEVQLPFLQAVLPEGFKLIPIVISNLPEDRLEPMGAQLLPYWDDETLVVASSDFTHYGPDFGYVPFTKEIPENLEKLDLGAVKPILALDEEGFTRYVERTGATICGRKPIALLLTMASKRKMKAELLHYTTSGALTGDWSHCVSYCSIAFFSAGGKQEEGAGAGAEDRGFKPLTGEEQQTLLHLARHTLRTFLRTGKEPEDLDRFQITDTLKERRGAFVTLKIEGRLRGCIGYLEGIRPLYEAVMDNTISAASRDPRFPPVRLSEEPKIQIEISVLSPIVPVKNLDEIQVGRDGLIIERGFHRGTLLPQVPVEQGWNRTEFLEALCRKAGLPRETYKEPGTVIRRYSAQVFGEGGGGGE